MKRIILTLTFFLLIVSGSTLAQLTDGWKILGQVQLRSELDGRDFSNSTHPLTFASSRIRLGVQKSFDEKVVLFIQAQDSRVFGSESGTLSNSTNLDLHQGYVQLNKLFNLNWSIQAGRFEVSYGTERFFGAVGWHYVGRSFDGVRLVLAPKKFDLHLFALTVKESVSYIGNANPGVYPYPQEPTPAHSIYGIWKKTKVNDRNKFDLFGYWELNREKTGLDTCKLNMLTLGGSYWGTFGNFSLIFEGGYQLGDMAGKDVGAYLVSLSAYYKANLKAGVLKLGLGADILSGTKPEDALTEMNSFQPTYGTNHKFYGFMDYFINVPKNAMGLGLHDCYFVSHFKPKESKWSFGATFHHFMTIQTMLITTETDPIPQEENMLGQEVDITVKYSVAKGTTLVWGGSLFFPSSIMKFMFHPREDTAFWTYVMLTANL